MSGFDDDDASIPRAGLNKLIKDVLPGLRVSAEARDCLSVMANEFIHHLSATANKICEEQQKRTITPEHVLEALKRMGFDDYLMQCESIVDDVKKVAAERRVRKSNSRWDTSGLSEEELAKMQQDLFERAKREQAESECAEWQEMQRQMSASSLLGLNDEENGEDDEDYS